MSVRRPLLGFGMQMGQFLFRILDLPETSMLCSLVSSAGSMERTLNWTAINEMLFSVIGLPLSVPLPS